MKLSIPAPKCTYCCLYRGLLLHWLSRETGDMCTRQEHGRMQTSPFSPSIVQQCFVVGINESVQLHTRTITEIHPNTRCFNGYLVCLLLFPPLVIDVNCIKGEKNTYKIHNSSMFTIKSSF